MDCRVLHDQLRAWAGDGRVLSGGATLGRVRRVRGGCQLVSGLDQAGTLVGIPEGMEAFDTGW